VLQFIFGKPSTGKTGFVIRKTAELSALNKKSLIIVPEQFSFETEKAVLYKLGDFAMLNTSVLSFSRLFDEVSRLTGGSAGEILSDAEKIIFMHRALLSSKDELLLWKKYVNSVSFAKTMLDTVGEFKINGISVYEIRNAAQKSEKQSLKYKLFDIAKIYEEYDTFIAEKYIDPTDVLTKLYLLLENSDYFKGKTVFLDSFKGFTGQQFKILERIFEKAENVYISFSYDPSNVSEYGIFANIRANVEKIKRIARSRAVEIGDDIVLKESYYKNKSLENVEKIIAGSKPLSSDNDGINIFKADTIFTEADFAASEIRRLVRTENYRYKDFVIISRDADSYKEAVAAACRKNKINLFFDNRVPLSSFPLATAVDSVIKALKLNTEEILRFNKTRLGTLSFEEVSTLENYTYLWGISGETWLNRWEMSPRGLNNGEITEKEKNEIVKINELRERALAPILSFKKNFVGDAKSMISAIITLFEEYGFSEKLSLMQEKFESENIVFSKQMSEQAFDSYIEILDSLASCFSTASVTVSQFSEALQLAVSLCDIGTIPQLLDQVSFGSADRIRPSRPKVAFILGANLGVFPKMPANNGVFNLFERRALIDMEIELSDNSVNSAIDEDYLVYISLCCPSEKLYVSYPIKSVSGEAYEPSGFVSKLKNGLSVTVFDASKHNNLPETNETLFTEFCRNIKTESAFTETLKGALSETEYSEKTEAIEELFKDKPRTINPQTALKLYGNDIVISPTKVEAINRCRFSYFCKYGLNIQKIQPADFNVMQRGTIVHYILERFISNNGKEIPLLTEQDTDLLTEKYLNEYLDGVAGYRAVEDDKVRYIVSLILRSVKEVVRHVVRELAQSEFEPKACEVKIGFEKDELNVSFPFDGGKISIKGSIDRLDEYNGYIRIIDYKTGTKSFDLPDILFGLNLQMLIYLYCVVRGRNLPDSKAAAILYQPAGRNITDGKLAMNGLLKNEKELVYAMERNPVGEFIPKYQLTKDGVLYKTDAKSFISEDEFSLIFDLIEKIMANTGKTLLSGDIGVEPLDGKSSSACAYCDFKSVCNFENKTPQKVPSYSNEEVFEIMKGGE